MASPRDDTTSTSAKTARRQRHSPDVRRAMIIDSARDIIIENGLQRTTIRDIARAADVAVGTVTYHFSGLAEVLLEVLDAEMTSFSADVFADSDGATTGLDGLRRLTDGLLAGGLRGEKHWKLWLDFWTLAAHDEKYARWQTQVIYRNLHGLAERLLERGRTDGSLPAVTDPSAQSVQYIAMMDGLVIQTYLRHGRLTADQARGLLQHYVTTAFAGK